MSEHISILTVFPRLTQRYTRDEALRLWKQRTSYMSTPNAEIERVGEYVMVHRGADVQDVWIPVDAIWDVIAMLKHAYEDIKSDPSDEHPTARPETLIRPRVDRG